MTTYYFVDTNIIIGYCNPFDRLHLVAEEFYKEIKNKHDIFLLLSVEKEFYEKIRTIMNIFKRKLSKFLRAGNKPDVIEIKKKILGKIGNKQYFFDSYIFDLFENYNLSQVSYSSMMYVLSKFNDEMRKSFNNLVNHWIKRPFANDYETVKLDSVYGTFIKNIGSLLHYPDNIHLALASYEVNIRNLDNIEHKYLFYTDDERFIYNDLEQVINLPNLKIKKINYTKEIRFCYNPITKNFNIRKEILKYIPS